MLTVDWYGSNDWFLTTGLIIALYCLLLPWGCFLFVRYLPWNGWFRAACCLTLTGLMELVSNGLTNWFVSVQVYEGAVPPPRSPPAEAFNLTDWQDPLPAQRQYHAACAPLLLGEPALICVALGIRSASSAATELKTNKSRRETLLSAALPRVSHLFFPVFSFP